MALKLLAFFISIAAYGQIVVTCPNVEAGATVTCSATGGTAPYTYTLTGGSAGSITSGGDYTAPATVTVQQAVGPCQMLPPDHVLNTRIDSLPVHADSGTIIALGGATTYHVTFETGWQTNFIVNSTGTTPMHFYYTAARDGDFQVLNWPNLFRQSGVFTAPFSGPDRHEAYVNRESCEFSEIYNRYNAGDNTIQSCPTCTGQSGIKYSNGFQLPDTSISNNSSTTAAGTYLQALSVHLSDIQAGEIKHALAMTMSNAWIKSGFVYQWPATASASPFCSGTCWVYGMYTRLKAATDISSYSATAQVLLNALKQYGAIVADGGTSYGFAVDTDAYLDGNTRAAMLEIINGSLRNSDFEVVDASSLKISDYSGAVNIRNGFVTPVQFAEVVATDSAMTSGTGRVSLQGVAVGVPRGAMTIMAGTPGIQLEAWVKGSANTAVSWAMSPSVGTLSGSGLYTAPASATSPTSTRITITSSAEATAKAYIDVLIWPNNDGGAFRVVPAKSSDLSYGGHTWWGRTYAHYLGWGTPGTWGGACSAGTPNTDAAYSYDDMIWHIWMPAGQYNVRLYTCVPSSYNPLDSNEFKFHYEAGGVVQYYDKPVVDIVGSAGSATPGYLDMTATVSGGPLIISVRNLAGTNPYPSMSALEVTPAPIHGTLMQGNATLVEGSLH